MRKRLYPQSVFLAVFLFLAISAAGAAAAEPMLRCRWVSPNTRAQQDVTFGGNPLVVMLPGEALQLECAPVPGKVTVLKDGHPIREGETAHFTAPETPGEYYIPVTVTAGGRSRDAELCVVVPHKASARKIDKGLNVRADGQEVGEYRHCSQSGNLKVRENPDCYQPPVWWFRITPENAAFEIVPGMRAEDLVAPTEDTGLRHTDLVPVYYPMWNTVATLRRALEQRGIPGRALKLISCFRTPSYNRMVGSNAFGRHIYGDAFDFYIDLEGDGRASDLNRDGKLDRRDAYMIVAIIEDLQADGAIPMGGIGVYNTIGGDHVVTMHLDTRGHRATWGYLYSASGKKSEFSWASRRFADLDRAQEDAAAARAAKEGKKYYRANRDPLQ